MPPEYGKRNDFVISHEMENACNQIGGRLGIDLGPFFDYYEFKVKKCKFTWFLEMAVYRAWAEYCGRLRFRKDFYGLRCFD